MAAIESAAKADIASRVASGDFAGMYAFCEDFELDLQHDEARARPHATHTVHTPQRFLSRASVHNARFGAPRAHVSAHVRALSLSLSLSLSVPF